MDYITWDEIKSMAVAHEGRLAVYVNNDVNFDDECEVRIWKQIIAEVKKLSLGDQCNTVIGGLICGGLFFFDTEEEQFKFYSIFEQDSIYGSPVYACTYDKCGKCITENT
jgi:hypothetical protein